MILANGCNITKSEKLKGVWILSVPTVCLDFSWMVFSTSFFRNYLQFLQHNSLNPNWVWLILCLQVNANELTNGVINAAFMLLFKDAIRLFAAYNEGIINLLGELLSCLSFQNLKWAVLQIDFYQLSILLVPLTETFELKVSAHSSTAA